MEHFRRFIEQFAFGVCSYLGEKMGIASHRVRIFFIYASFLTLGSPVIFYLIVAFWMNLKKYIQQKVHPIWD